jgi:SAM-dependent methyltransferase
MKEQIWEAKNDLNIYSNLSAFEFAQIETYIGSPKIILEAGCGLGRGSIFLNHLLRDENALYILADRSGCTTNSGEFAPKVDEFYNDLDLTKDFCALNGVRKFMTFDTEEDDWSTLPRVDLIFSLCAFGMLVPIERYIDRLIAAAKPNSTMIFGTRGANYGPKSFEARFEEVLYKPGRDSLGMFPTENWLVLRNPVDR